MPADMVLLNGQVLTMDREFTVLAVPQFLGLFWKRGNRRGAAAGMLLGFATAAVLQAVRPTSIPSLGGLTSGVVGLIVNLAVYVGCAYAFPNSAEEHGRVVGLFAETRPGGRAGARPEAPTATALSGRCCPRERDSTGLRAITSSGAPGATGEPSHQLGLLLHQLRVGRALAHRLDAALACLERVVGLTHRDDLALSGLQSESEVDLLPGALAVDLELSWHARSPHYASRTGSCCWER
jgi:hypothetical protein